MRHFHSKECCMNSLWTDFHSKNAKSTKKPKNISKFYERNDMQNMTSSQMFSKLFCILHIRFIYVFTFWQVFQSLFECIYHLCLWYFCCRFVNFCWLFRKLLSVFIDIFWKIFLLMFFAEQQIQTSFMCRKNYNLIF